MFTLTLDTLTFWFISTLESSQTKIHKRYLEYVCNMLRELRVDQHTRLAVAPASCQAPITPNCYRNLLRPALDEIALEIPVLLEHEIPTQRPVPKKRFWRKSAPVASTSEAAPHKVRLHWCNEAPSQITLHLDGILLRTIHRSRKEMAC